MMPYHTTIRLGSASEQVPRAYLRRFFMPTRLSFLHVVPSIFVFIKFIVTGMPDLPAGWRVRNSTGSWAAPAQAPVDHDDYDVAEDEGLEAGDLRPDSPGWEDVEADAEEIVVKSLLDDEVFGSVRAMVDHCKQKYDFDLNKVRKANSTFHSDTNPPHIQNISPDCYTDLDFLATLRLINYIRTQVSQGNSTPDCSDPSLWADDKYMQPVLEDDALLYSIDDLAVPGDASDPLAQNAEAEIEEPSAGQRTLVERALR